MEALDSDIEKRHSGPNQSPKISKLDTLELIADQIIDIATVKGQPRFIDEDRPEDNVSYEESEKRLTNLAFFFAISSSIVSSICLILVMDVMMIQGPRIRIAGQSGTDKVKDTFPLPYVLLMGKSGIGDGTMLVFQQVNQSYFQYGWKFKLPKQQDEIDRYFLFEDLGQVHVAYGNMRLPMTVLNPSTKLHFTIPKSKLKRKFIDGNSLRIGKFVMIFGGIEDKSDVTSEIWSMERQVWIKGPYLPNKVQGAIFTCGVPVNRHHGLVFIERNLCIDAYTYSVESFAWSNIKQCVIGMTPDFVFTLKLTCSSYMDKDQKMFTVMLHTYVNQDNTFQHKIFSIDATNFTNDLVYVQVLDNCRESNELTIFELRNQIYFARFDRDFIAFYTLEIENKTLIEMQELEHPDPLTFAQEELEGGHCNMILAWQEVDKQALPFYT